MRRRKFIILLTGAAATRSVAARAQQPGPMRRIAVLTVLAEDDPEHKARLGGFKQGLQGLGWSQGRNAHLDITLEGRVMQRRSRARFLPLNPM
jgi:hypothetical protein